MQVLLIRHGDAMSAADALRSGTDDAQRPLTVRGEAQVAGMANVLLALTPPVDAIFHSPLVRARQTADLLAVAWPNASLSVTDSLQPPVDTHAVATLLARSGASCAMLVGHEPSMTELAVWLLRGVTSPPFAFGKGGAALLSFAGAPEANAGKLKWLLPPDVALDR